MDQEVHNKEYEAFVEPNFKTLFEQAPSLYMVLDPNLRIVAASDAYLESTLTRREEILGRYVFDVFPDNPEDPSADSMRNSLASFNRVLRTGETDTMIVQRHDVRRPESEGGGFAVRYWSPINSPILNPDGSVAYILHRVENVTEFVELKQHGTEQAKLTDELRERTMQMEADLYARSREVAESSLKLKQANEELVRLYEKARELDELKSRFFANVSHELRTPLTLILGPVRKILLADNVTEEQRHDLMVVERNAHALLRNVNDLLDLSKLDAGRTRMEYAEIDLAWLARFVASHFETVADEKEISFNVETPKSLPAQVDPEKVRRVLFNLLSNAVKFTPEQGSVCFNLGVDDETAVFTVEDTGPGIPEGMRQAIFERFRQVDSSSTRQYGGTGLGLAIVKEFVNLHHGSVEVTEAPGGGARFVVELPLAAPYGVEVKTAGSIADEEAAQEAITELETQVGMPTHCEPSVAPDAPLVLVVEDNPEMNSFITESLRDRYRVATAFDGQEGLEKALSLRPDLILSDIMMPRMSGDEMVREVRRHQELDDVPILLLTAKADEGLRVELLSSGVQDFLVKPFVTEELVARAAGLINRKRKTEISLKESCALLRISEERYRTLFEAIDEGFCIIEVIFDENEKPVDYRFLETNPAFEKQTGLIDVHGKRIRELSPKHEEHWFEIFGKIALTGQPVRFENRAKRLHRWYDVYAIRFGQPESRQVAVLFNDITERKRAEETLRQKEAELTEAQRIAHVGSWYWDAKTDATTGSDELLRIYGLDPMTQSMPAFGEQDGLLYPHESWQLVNRAVQRAMETGVGYELDVEAKRANCDRIWITTRGEVVRDDNVRIVGMRGTVQDITERKHAEEKVRKLNDELEQRVAQRTSELENVNKELEAFSYSVSHDLGAPLRRIDGFSHLLVNDYSDKLDEQGKDYLERMHDNTQKMRQLIDDLLGFSRAARAEMKRQSVDLSHMAQEVAAELSQTQAGRQAQFIIEPEMAADADLHLMRIMLDNLLGNAWKFTGKRDVAVIEFEVTHQDGERVYQIRDNGAGFDMEDADKLFTPFQRMHTEDEFPGTGIGLALVQRIIHRHGGRIWAEAEVDKGATFYFTLGEQSK